MMIFRFEKVIFYSVFPYLALIFLNLTACEQKQNSMEKPRLNRLANASSPYLQEHADNPVDWYEWGPAALEKAKKENKPLLISIGYSACHWCHVMERESYMDTTVAKLMNKNFVCIKVDREERPDIDQIYINAAQLLNGQAGWPLNAVALPDGKPFFVGTYFPKENWINVLQQLRDAYKNKYDLVVKQAESLTKGIQEPEFEQFQAPQNDFNKKDYEALFEHWRSSIDFDSGGFKGAPKFPMPTAWEFLLQYQYLTGNQKALDAVAKTLDEMAKGGIYDQLGGGFARYSTDADWFAPHFEKMLYDNGQLVSLYAHAYKITKKSVYAEVIRETLDFVQNELTDPNGGFYASLNADSEGEEGKFYVWTSREIQENLDPDTAALFMKYYQVKQGGNWENGENILFRKEELTAFSEPHELEPEVWKKRLSEAKTKLLKIRNQREHPSTDDKILTSWNALMLKGYIDAYQALGDEAYLKIALKSAQFLNKTMTGKEGKLFRNFKDGKKEISAFLDDYALLASAYISLYEATLEIKWLKRARTLADYVCNHFHAKKNKLFYYTPDTGESLVARKMEVADNVIPSSNSVMAQVLYRLGEYYELPAYKKRSAAMLGQVIGGIGESGVYYGNWASLSGWIAYPPFEVAVVGADAFAKSKKIQRHFLPTSFFMGGRQENLPLLENKVVTGQTIIYVCQDKTCKLPLESAEGALKLLH